MPLLYWVSRPLASPKRTWVVTPKNPTTIIPTHRNNQVLLYYSVIQNLPKHGQAIFSVWFLVLPGPFHLSFSMRCPIIFHASLNNDRQIHVLVNGTIYVKRPRCSKW